MSICLEHMRVEGWPAIVLENDALRVAVIPELGGKIVSLRSQSTGREWLWKNPYLQLAKPPLGATNFGLYDSGGWDEIFPTVNPCKVPDSAWGNRVLTDHGELWYRQWENVEERVDDASASLTLFVAGPDMPFRFERTLKLAAGRGELEVTYNITNISDRLFPCLWAAHSLIAIEPDNEIHLPANTRMSSSGSIGLDLASDSLPFAWPNLRLNSRRSIDLSRVPERNAGFAIKLFAEKLSPQNVQIVDHTHQDSLQISFAQEQLVNCGLWLNYGAWSGAGTKPYFNLGIEPTTSPHDDLSIAIRQDAALSVHPGGSHHWNVKVLVGKESA